MKKKKSSLGLRFLKESRTTIELEPFEFNSELLIAYKAGLRHAITLLLIEGIIPIELHKKAIDVMSIKK